MLIADDDERILESVQFLLESQCEIVGTVREGQALDPIVALKPEVVVRLYISMSVLNGFGAPRKRTPLSSRTSLQSEDACAPQILLRVSTEMGYTRARCRQTGPVCFKTDDGTLLTGKCLS